MLRYLTVTYFTPSTLWGKSIRILMRLCLVSCLIIPTTVEVLLLVVLVKSVRLGVL